MKMQDIQDIHSGSIGFIIGSGPSLHTQDVRPLENYVTIAVNSGILKMPDSDYFVSDDQGIRSWNYYRQTLKSSKCKKLMFEDKLSDSVEFFGEDEVALFKHKTWYDPKSKKKYPGGVDLTRDASLPIVGARTSMGSAIHCAYIMGCDPIVLLGCDCCFSGRKRYFWEFPGERKAIRVDGRPNNWSPKRGKDGKVQDRHCLDFIDYWEDFSNANKDVNIIYASEGGALDVFPKMTLLEVLEKYSDRLK